MLIQSTSTGRLASVSEEYGEQLLAGSSWRLPRKPRTPKHSKSAPDEEPSTEE